MNRGIAYAALAYLAWGLFPLYFKQIAEVPSIEVVMHRTLWCVLFLIGVLTILKRWAWLRELRAQPKVLAAFMLSALLLSVNWVVYVWAVQTEHVLDASLGYFINPLVNVALSHTADQGRAISNAENFRHDGLQAVCSNSSFTHTSHDADGV